MRNTFVVVTDTPALKEESDAQNHLQTTRNAAVVNGISLLRRIGFGLTAVLWIITGITETGSAAQQKPFYHGKTVTIISWPTAGGSTDVAARLYAKHLPRFVPGNPEMVVKIISGAGGIVAANYMYELAKPDGLTLWVNEPPLALTQLAGESSVKFDMLGYAYIGAIEKQSQLALLSGSLPFDTLAKLRAAKEPIRASARRVGSSDYVGAKAIEALGVPMKIVTGYSGTGEQLTALERGEAHLFIASMSAIKSLRPDWLKPKPGVIHHIAALGFQDPSVAHVPNIKDLAPVHGKEGFVKLADFLARAPRRILSGPPKTSNGIIKILRESFMQMARDEAFLAEAEKLSIEVGVVPGEEVSEMITQFVTDPIAKKMAPELMSK